MNRATLAIMRSSFGLSTSASGISAGTMREIERCFSSGEVLELEQQRSSDLKHRLNAGPMSSVSDVRSTISFTLGLLSLFFCGDFPTRNLATKFAIESMGNVLALC